MLGVPASLGYSNSTHMKKSLLGLLFLITTGCELGYLFKSGYHQALLLRRRIPIEEALKRADLSAEEKSKLQLAMMAREFAEQDLGLKPTENYKSYVQLEDPYVTYIVSVAEKFNLKSVQWSYPIVGEVPYKGFFEKKDALTEAEVHKKKGYDVFVRGVSAYSTLGWFKDPLLSSMIRYEPYDLVNLIIHETTHATIFLKGNADFNERLATYIGNKGTELFYKKIEGDDSPTLKKSAENDSDDKVFSQYITHELEDLKRWYVDLGQQSHSEEEKLLKRAQRFEEMKKRYREKIVPLLKTETYKKFAERDWNNAFLMGYQTYLKDLDAFERLYQRTGSIAKMLEVCRNWQGSKDPDGLLKDFLSSKPADGHPSL